MLGKLARNATLRRQRYDDGQFGHIAAAMGLEVEIGDPRVDLVHGLPDRFQDVAEGRFPLRPRRWQLDLCATGLVQGRSVELSWSDAADRRRGLLASTVTYCFNGYLSVSSPSTMEPFEVTNRERSRSGFDPRPVFDGPEVPLDIPEVDATYRLTSAAALPPQLAHLIADLAVQDWIHVVWDGETISHRLHPYCGAMFTDPAATLDGLLAMAAVLEAEQDLGGELRVARAS
ncbi:MAG: hypothetical protein JWM47_3577 [Acidimicrobiales bacterium]|nr:hypothetical protein [Acidimicrobiales bacterium]